MRIPELFDGRGPVFSFEFFLPKAPDDMELFRATVRELRDMNPSFVTLTYGAGGSARERTIETAGAIQREFGIPTASHLTCITHTKAEISALLDRLKGLGIGTIVALRGDPPKDVALPPVDQRDFRYAVDLIRFIKSRHPFDMAVAGYPEVHPEAPSKDFDLNNLKAKVAAGGSWVITQLFFDNARYFEFVARARAAGIDKPIVPGIMPVTNVAQLERFTTMCGATIPASLSERLKKVAADKEAVIGEGIDYAHRQCRELLDKGAPGIHFYTLNKSRSTIEVLKRLRG